MGLILQLRLLGAFELRRPDGAAVALPGRQSMAILACLGLTEGFALPRERLAGLIWAGRGEQADGSLRQELTRLRRALGEHVLPAGGTVAQPIRLDPERVDIDVARFHAAAGQSGAPRRRWRSIAARCSTAFRYGRRSRWPTGWAAIASVCATLRGRSCCASCVRARAVPPSPSS